MEKFSAQMKITVGISKTQEQKQKQNREMENRNGIQKQSWEKVL